MIKEMNTSSTKLYKNSVAEYHLRKVFEEIKKERERLNKLENKVESYRLLAKEGLIFDKPKKIRG